MNELKERVKDVVGVIKVVIEEGIVFGGGVVFFCVVKVFDLFKFDNDDEKVGIKIVVDVFF